MRWLLAADRLGRRRRVALSEGAQVGPVLRGLLDVDVRGSQAGDRRSHLVGQLRLRGLVVPAVMDPVGAVAVSRGVGRHLDT